MFQSGLPTAALGALPVPVGELPNDVFTKCQEYGYFRRFQREGLYEFFRPLEGPQAPVTRLGGHDVIMLGANSYLGLTNDERVKAAAIAAIKRYGTGCSGSPLVNGTTDLHVRLEAELCRVMGVEACALFSTGFQTNVGSIGCLVGEGDLVLSDSLNHASIVEGCRLAKGDVRPFRHNDVADLERQLAADPGRAKLVVVDGVYSMGGDLAPLPEIVALVRQYGARLLVDDAHGFGVMGPGGRGTAAHFGLSGQVDLTMLTFSKSLGTIGGCLLGPADVIHFVKHQARSYVFSATMPAGNVAATLASLALLTEGEALRQRLRDNVRIMREGLKWLGFRLSDGGHHIIAVAIGDDDLTLTVTRRMREEGVFVSGIVPPGVAVGEAMIRVTPMASHTPAELGRALAAFASVGRACGLIS